MDKDRFLLDNDKIWSAELGVKWVDRPQPGNSQYDEYNIEVKTAIAKAAALHAIKEVLRWENEICEEHPNEDCPTRRYRCVMCWKEFGDFIGELENENMPKLQREIRTLYMRTHHSGGN